MWLNISFHIFFKSCSIGLLKAPQWVWLQLPLHYHTHTGYLLPSKLLCFSITNILFPEILSKQSTWSQLLGSESDYRRTNLKTLVIHCQLSLSIRITLVLLIYILYKWSSKFRTESSYWCVLFLSFELKERQYLINVQTFLTFCISVFILFWNNMLRDKRLGMLPSYLLRKLFLKSSFCFCLNQRAHEGILWVLWKYCWLFNHTHYGLPVSVNSYCI